MERKITRMTLVLTALLLSVFSAQAQETVMKVNKTDGTSTHTRISELKQIDVFTKGDTTLVTRLTNGAVFRT